MRAAATRTLVAAALVLAIGASQAMAGGPYGKTPISPLAKKEGFTALTKAIQVAGLRKTLTVDGPFTIFAPTDEAFSALPEGTLQYLLDNPKELKQVLLYHVLAGEFMAADVLGLTSATTLNGADISIDASSGVVLNGSSTVTATDVMAKNEVVHVIDAVLIPPTE